MAINNESTNSQTLLDQLFEDKIKQLIDYLLPMDKDQVSKKIIEAEKNTSVLLEEIFLMFKKYFAKDPSIIEGSITLVFESVFNKINKEASEKYPNICQALYIIDCESDTPILKPKVVFNSKMLEELFISNGFGFQILENGIIIRANLYKFKAKELHDKAYQKKYNYNSLD